MSFYISVTFFCAVLGAQGICATGFKCAQGNAHCAKFESNTIRMIFETNAISTTSGIQARTYISIPLYSLECMFYTTIVAFHILNII